VYYQELQILLSVKKYLPKASVFFYLFSQVHPMSEDSDSSRTSIV